MTSHLYDSTDPEFYMCFAQTSLACAELWLKKCGVTPQHNSEYRQAEFLVKEMGLTDQLRMRKRMLMRLKDILFEIHKLFPLVEPEYRVVSMEQADDDLIEDFIDITVGNPVS